MLKMILAWNEGYVWLISSEYMEKRLPCHMQNRYVEFIHAKPHSLLYKSDKVSIMYYVKSKHYGLMWQSGHHRTFYMWPYCSLEITIWKIIMSFFYVFLYYNYGILVCCNFYYWTRRNNYIICPRITTEIGLGLG